MGVRLASRTVADSHLLRELTLPCCEVTLGRGSSSAGSLFSDQRDADVRLDLARGIKLARELLGLNAEARLRDGRRCILLELIFLHVEAVLDKGSLGTLNGKPQLGGNVRENAAAGGGEEGKFSAGLGRGVVVDCRSETS